MDDLNMQARGQSLKDLMGAMDEDSARSVPAIMLKITAGPSGIEVEKTGGDGELNDGDEKELGAEPQAPDQSGNGPTPPQSMGGGNAFEELLARKKQERQGVSR